MIIHLNGWPGVGKLTIARHLQTRLGAKLLDNHTFYNPAFALTEFRSPQFYALVRRVRDAAFDQVAALPAETPVIITNALGISDWASENLAAVTELARRQNALLFAVSLTCAPDEHRRRIVAADRTGKLRDPAAIDDYAARRLGVPETPHHLALDVTTIAAEDSAAKIAAWIANV